jgi:hypothetical protein
MDLDKDWIDNSSAKHERANESKEKKEKSPISDFSNTGL